MSIGKHFCSSVDTTYTGRDLCSIHIAVVGLSPSRSCHNVKMYAHFRYGLVCWFLRALRCLAPEAMKPYFLKPSYTTSKVAVGWVPILPRIPEVPASNPGPLPLVSGKMQGWNFNEAQVVSF